MNLVLVTSVISPPKKPLSYTKTRSVYGTDERYRDTKKTIESIKVHIPNCYIVVVECSELNIEHEEYFNENVDCFVNFYNDTKIRECIHSKFKGIGESNQTINAIKYIKENINIEFKHFYKISGRYWIADDLDYSIFDNDKIVVKQIKQNKNNILTALYKVPFSYMSELKEFFISEQSIYKRGIGFEVSFAKFITKNKDNVIYLDRIHLQGYVSVSKNCFYNG